MSHVASHKPVGLQEKQQTSKAANRRDISVSVLMSTYERETAANLALSLGSIYAQTRPADECVVVLDGPVDHAQEGVLERFAAQGPTPLRVVRLPARKGLANALNEGLAHCSGTHIARMDSDDVSMPNRFESQIRAYQRMPELDACFSWHAEFMDDPEKIINLKKCPREHKSIASLLKWRNCLSHPTLMVRRDVLLAVGGYRSQFGVLEDYDLYVRLVQAGAQFTAIQKPLVLVRTGPGQHARRGGSDYARLEIGFRLNCWRNGFLNLAELAVTLPLLVGFRLTPVPVKKFLYHLVRTSKPTTVPTALSKVRDHAL